MTPIVLLFALGLILLGAEVFVPGGILGIFGGLALLGGCVLAFIGFGAAGGLLAIATAAVLSGLLLYVEFRILPRTAVGQRLFLRSSVTGQSPAAPATPDLVGRTAEAETVLAPSGYVRVEGRRYEAFSQSGYVPAGALLRVVGSDNFRLIVTQA